ncbi:hypothetical protein fHeYen901_28 [Yersinia phage fHe-Yen9-01]|uniref:Uncharacterized protein n=1 Tax=Yersinia phage fHe-Yen9-01 TaxID=1965363 RepID=A0A1V0DXC6_9CAUD|nr:RNA polymerase ADP-ribosylase [Yersinia phage fHe-Yen9-01]ARB05801.1 hypothetical protein fHeYen901_28 [Yersinia phage fHe-Yen9-01]
MQQVISDIQKYEAAQRVNFLSDWEKSVLYRCMSAKAEDLQYDLEEIIAQYSSFVSGLMYRGLSRTQAKIVLAALDTSIMSEDDKAMFDLEENEGPNKFSFPRVTSVSAEYHIALDFASEAEYGTNVILKVLNLDYAFNYTDRMLDILHSCPSADFQTGINISIESLEMRRRANIEMLDGEAEWMISRDASYTIEDAYILNRNLMIEVSISFNP